MTVRGGAGHVANGGQVVYIGTYTGGRRAYAPGELDSTLTACEYDAACGVLRPVQTLSTLPGDLDGDPVKEPQYLDTLLRRRVDGLLIGPTPDSAPYLRRFQQQGIKVVLLDRTVEGIEADVARSHSRGGAE